MAKEILNEMTQKNVKERNVLDFKEFRKADETSSKTILTRKGQNPDPGAHEIKAEDVYVKNDANVYKAAGIKHNEKIADAADMSKAESVTKFDGVKESKKGEAEFKLLNNKKEVVSNCCGASPVNSPDGPSTAELEICPKCKEHCTYVTPEEFDASESRNVLRFDQFELNEDKVEVWFVLDKDGNAKNLSTSFDDADSFLKRQLKGNGSVDSTKVDRDDYESEKVNVTNIKNHAEGAKWETT